MGANRVLGHSKFVRYFARRVALHKQRRHCCFAHREAVKPRQPIRLGFRRAFRIGECDRDGVGAAKGARRGRGSARRRAQARDGRKIARFA